MYVWIVYGNDGQQLAVFEDSENFDRIFQESLDISYGRRNPPVRIQVDKRPNLIRAIVRMEERNSHVITARKYHLQQEAQHL